MAASPLRLLVVGIAWPPETFLRRLLDGLSARGVQVTLAMRTPPDAAWLRQPNHAWLRMPAEHSTLQRALRFTGAAGRSIAARLHTRQMQRGFAQPAWDVLYLPWNATAVEHPHLFDLGIPVVISCRGAQINIAPHNPARGALRAGLQATFERAAAVHCVSQAILREAQQYGLDPQKARVIHPAVDPAFFTPANARQPDDAFHIISTGALIWRKGYEYALCAIRLLKDRGVPVVYQIIGDGPEKDRVLFTIHDLGLQDAVRLPSKRSPEQVRAHLQQADAFLLPSLSEGISNAALEAMACGLPVVSSDCGGMREAIHHGVEGWLAPLRDATALAAGLEHLYRDPLHAQAMGRAARERVLRDFALEQQVSKFLGLLQQVIRQP